MAGTGPRKGTRARMMLAAVLAAAAVGALDLKPVYHFTRAAHEMNDPNGLMAVPDPNGVPPNGSSGEPAVTYHMYFQSNDPGQSVGSVWGHAVSSDLVRWRRLNRTGVKGSSGGGVWLPPDSPTRANAATAAWNATVFASVPMFPPAVHPGVGLSVWHSDDAQLLDWDVQGGGSCQGTLNVSGGPTGIICPALVPNNVSAGYIGDNYAWKERGTDGNWTFFLLSGSNKCPPGKPWCGYGFAGTTPQALLFRSDDLLTWRFQSVFWSGEPQPGNRVDTPDTFPLADGSQAFLWLTGGHTVWMRGEFDRTTWTFEETDKGAMDPGSLFCQQSMDDLRGRRVQFGWVTVAGDGWSGAQSLPRIVTLSDAAQRLTFDAHPSVWTLHGDRADVAQVNVSAGGRLDLTSTLQPVGDGTGLHVHLRVAVTVPLASAGLTVSIHVLGGAAHGGSTVTLTSSGEANQCAGSDPNAGVANNTDTTGTLVGASPYSLDPNATGQAGAAQCKALCCKMQDCMRWTFTDPQPGAPDHLCWLKSGPGVTFPSACPGGHCWGGDVVPPPPPPAPTPPPPACNATEIFNSTDTGGSFVGKSPYTFNSSVFGLPGATQCQALCCATKGCLAWTYTDPQPGSAAHLCWLKDGSGGAFPSSCGGGHCWSGLVGGQVPVTPLHPVRRPLSLAVSGASASVELTDADAGLDSGDTADALVDLFLDGGVLEVFANNGEASVTATHPSATLTNASVEVTGAAGSGVTVAATAWSMQPSVE